MSDALQRLRFLAQSRAPSWLRGKNGATFLYVLGRMLDRTLDAAVEAVKHRYPGYISYEGLSLSGRERGMRRGIFETDAFYAERLLRWIESKQLLGSPSELLNQLYWFHRPDNAGSTQIIERSGHRYTMGTGTPTEPGAIDEDMIADWSPDDRPDLWARFMLLIVGLPVYHVAPPDIQARALADLKALVIEHSPARCNGEVIIYDDSGSYDDLWDAIPPPPSQPELEAGLWDSDTATWDAGSEPLIIEF